MSAGYFEAWELCTIYAQFPSCVPCRVLRPVTAWVYSVEKSAPESWEGSGSTLLASMILPRAS